MATPPLPDDVLLEAVRVLDLCGGNQCRAAEMIGISRGGLQNRIALAERRGLTRPEVVRAQMAAVGGSPAQASHGWIVTPTEDGGRTSTFWKADDGNAMCDFALSLAAEIEAMPEVPRPQSGVEALCNLYTLTDAHVGMLAWHKEGGADWNVKEAERVLGGCFRLMVQSAPPAETGIVAILGDWLHYDGLEAVTPTNRHVLDSDTRFPKLAETGARIMRQVVADALSKHPRVHVVVAEGNHDPASSVWLRIMLKALFEANPRVTIDDSELPFYAHRHGKTMLAWHHGHTVKADKLPLVMAAQFREMWGVVKHCHIHTGHKHHTEEKEHAGAVVTQHPTLAARDAYAARHGWHSLRRASVITYHHEFGEVGRAYVSPEMLA